MKKRRKPEAPPLLFAPQVARAVLTLARLEARVGLVDDVDAALAAHDAAVLVAQLHGLQRMTDLHGPDSTKSPSRAGVNSKGGRKIGRRERPVNPETATNSPMISNGLGQEDTTVQPTVAMMTMRLKASERSFWRSAMAKFTHDHVHLRSPDPEATAQYYERMFGAEVLRTVQQGKPRVDLNL